MTVVRENRHTVRLQAVAHESGGEFMCLSLDEGNKAQYSA